MIQPPLGNNHIVIEQNQILSPCLPQPLVDRGRKAHVPSISNNPDRHGRHILNARQVIPGAIGRAVIDDNKLPRLPRMAAKRSETMPGKLKLIPARNDNRSQGFHDDPPRIKPGNSLTTENTDTTEKEE